MRPSTQPIEFENDAGETLSARLEVPASAPRAHALFAHCFTCSKNVAAAVRISRELCARGIAVLRFDFTGLGESEGDFAETSFSSNVRDLVAAAAWLRENGGAPEILVGHSLGGAAVLAATNEIPEVRAVATIGAPSDPGHLQHLFDADTEEIERTGRASVTIAGRPFQVSREFLEDIAEQKLEPRLRELSRALFIFHSPDDDVVSIDHARRIYSAAKHPKSFISLDGADHLLTRAADAEYVAESLAALVSRYLDAPAAANEPHEPTREGVVRVTERDGGLAQEIIAGRHRLAADEPVRLGGTDTGPTPYGLLLAALGSCTTMTLRMYANHKGLPLESISCELTHAKVHAEDCTDCENAASRIDRIERVLTLEGDLTDEQRERMLEIADRCPVHRTLVGEKEILTRLA